MNYRAVNLLLIFLSMGFVAHSAPNYISAKATYGIDAGPILVQSIVHQPLFAQVNGVFNMVFGECSSITNHFAALLTVTLSQPLEVCRSRDSHVA